MTRPPDQRDPSGAGPSARDSGTECPECGAAAKARGTRCRDCGVRLDTRPLPVAPPPPIKTTAGARALMVLSVVILTAAVPTLLLRLTGGPEPERVVAAVASSTTAPPALVKIGPVRVDCSSELELSTCAALTDDDPTTAWSVRWEGADPEVIFWFSPPVTLRGLTITNLSGEEPFRRHARTAGLEIHLGDTSQAVVEELPDAPGAHEVALSGSPLSRLTLHITSVYEGEHVNGEEPFDELVLEGIEFTGMVAP